MPLYHWLGQPVDLAERDFLVNLVRPTSYGLLTWAQTIFYGHMAGFPDISGRQAIRGAEATQEIMDRTRPQIADDRLRDLCGLVRDKAAEMLPLDNEAVELVAGYLGRLPLDRKKLYQYIESKQFAADHPSGAVWRSEPDYRRLRRRSLAIFDEAWLLDRDIAARIKELVEAQGEVYEDITAHDTAPILRPLEQLRGMVEAMRGEIKKFSGLGEQYTRFIIGDLADLLSGIDKDSSSS
jgi:hypothetical protein